MTEPEPYRLRFVRLTMYDPGEEWIRRSMSWAKSNGERDALRYVRIVHVYKSPTNEEIKPTSILVYAYHDTQPCTKTWWMRIFSLKSSAHPRIRFENAYDIGSDPYVEEPQHQRSDIVWSYTRGTVPDLSDGHLKTVRLRRMASNMGMKHAWTAGITQVNIFIKERRFYLDRAKSRYKRLEREIIGDDDRSESG